MWDSEVDGWLAGMMVQSCEKHVLEYIVSNIVAGYGDTKNASTSDVVLLLKFVLKWVQEELWDYTFSSSFYFTITFAYI